MKLQNKWFIGAMLGAAVCLVSTSCVDEIKFGNSFGFFFAAISVLLSTILACIWQTPFLNAAFKRIAKFLTFLLTKLGETIKSTTLPLNLSSEQSNCAAKLNNSVYAIPVPDEI